MSQPTRDVVVIGMVTPATRDAMLKSLATLPTDGPPVLLAVLDGDAEALRAAIDAPAVDVVRLPDWCSRDDIPKVMYLLALERGAQVVVDCRANLDWPTISQAVARLEETGSALCLLRSRAAESCSTNSQLADYTGVAEGDFPVRLRAIRRDFLEAVPYQINSPWPLFDLELLCQAAYLETRIETVTATTSEADAVAVAPPSRLAAAGSLTGFAAHRRGMACSLRYRNLTPIRYQDKTQVMYTSHSMALAELADLAPKRVLDIGCGPGFLAERCREMGAAVTGLDMFDPLPGKLDDFRRCNIDSEPLPVDAFDYDALLLLDVIEHLREPEAFLLGIRNRAKPLAADGKPPTLLLSTPNVAFAAVRLNLLLGRFNYAERGILDITHTRLMTRRSLLNLLADCGYDVESIQPVPVPFAAVWPGKLGRFLSAIASPLARIWPAMFAFQFLVRCRPRPGVRQVLAELIDTSPAAP